MIKRLLTILVLVSLTVTILAGCGHEPPDGKVAETPSTSSPETKSEAPDTSKPDTPSTLTMLSITEGDIFVLKAGAGDWVEAEVGTTLEVGDSVKSGDNSNAEITFFDGSTIELLADTQIEVASLDIATDTCSTTTRILQEIGDTISKVEKLVDLASLYEVETPAGVAAVRGSVMYVFVTEDGTTQIDNHWGNIWAIAQGVELQIPADRKCIIIPGSPPQLISQAYYDCGD